MDNKKLIKRAILETAKPKYNQQNLSNGVNGSSFFGTGIKPTPGMKQQQNSPGYFGGFMRGLFTGDHPLGRFNNMVSNTTSNAGKLGSMAYNWFTGKNANKPALAKSGSVLEKRSAGLNSMALNQLQRPNPAPTPARSNAKALENQRRHDKALENQHSYAKALENQRRYAQGRPGVGVGPAMLTPGMKQQRNQGSQFMAGLNSMSKPFRSGFSSGFNSIPNFADNNTTSALKSIGFGKNTANFLGDAVGWGSRILGAPMNALVGFWSGAGNTALNRWNEGLKMMGYNEPADSKAGNLGKSVAEKAKPKAPKVPTVENSSFANKNNSAIVGAI